jgi:hypothetical protein
MDEISNDLKYIYNTFLKVRAEIEGRPYRHRKDFKKFKDIHFLEKLGRLFSSYPHINKEHFFRAPYKVWNDVSFFNLEFYTKRKALKCYVEYKKYLLTLSPDDSHHLKAVIDSFYFIKSFCIKENISPKNYLEHKDGIFSFLTHLKEDRVSIYALFTWDNFRSVFKNEVDSELKNMLYGDMYLEYDILYRKYINSKKCRELSKKCLQKIT